MKCITLAAGMLLACTQAMADSQGPTVQDFPAPRAGAEAVAKNAVHELFKPLVAKNYMTTIDIGPHPKTAVVKVLAGPHDCTVNLKVNASQKWLITAIQCS